MLKFPLHQRGRTRFYWDGPSLQAYAEAMGDPSLLWLDLPALARAGGLEADHVWIAPTPPPDRSGRAAVGAYAKVLGALGVDRRAAAGGGVERECLRCGHGWREARTVSELTLALAVLGDAMADAYDAAFVFAPAHVPCAINGLLARQFPDKRLGRVTFASGRRQRFEGPVLALGPAQVVAARLSPPGVGQRLRPQFDPIVQPATVEASP